MDDLNGLEWNSNPNSKSTQVPPAAARGTGNYYGPIPTLAPTPPIGSRNGTPLPTQSIRSTPPIAPAKPTTDMFAGLGGFGQKKETLTLQQQQEKLQVETRKQEEGRRKKEGNVFSFEAFENDDPFGLKKGKQSPAPSPQISKPTMSAPPRDDDDDIFGLGNVKTVAKSPAYSAPADDDDFLGDLGRPVEEIKREKEEAKERALKQRQTEESSRRQREFEEEMRRPKQTTPRVPSPRSVGDGADSDDPFDRAVNELVDMGFTADNSRRALTESGAGLSMQAAVGWLLKDAHAQAKAEAESRSSAKSRSRDASGSRGPSSGRAQNDGSDDIPAWARGEGGQPSQVRRGDNRSPALNADDVAAKAAALSANFLKSANSLWGKTQKKMQKAVAEFQQDELVDPSQPKWMRDVAAEQRRPKEKEHLPKDIKPNGASPSVTDEALALEMGSGPPSRRSARATPEIRQPASALPATNNPFARDRSPATLNQGSGRSSPLPKWQQSASSRPLDARSRLNKLAQEEEVVYISPARRKKTTSSPKPPVDEPDLLFDDGPGPTSGSQQMPDFSRRPDAGSKSHQIPDFSSKSQSRASPASKLSSTKPSPPLVVRPKAPTRRIPPVDPSALARSHKARLAGTEYFKLGDYAAAHEAYTQSLSSLPATHPVTIILLCNHALTSLKTGDSKGAVSDADKALEIIGPGQGAGETIDLEGSSKDMKEFYGKTLMRKAEGLEQMERWADAAAVWKSAVESGVGGATAIQGRQRCERGLAPNAKPVARVPAILKSAAQNGLSSMGEPYSKAVIRMREANAEAEKADDEKFALGDAVDARVSAWRDGRRDNLRALLGAMDQVLWEGSGWKKVGLHELVMNNKVKINYMKAIGKCHPDKVCEVEVVVLMLTRIELTKCSSHKMLVPRLR